MSRRKRPYLPGMIFHLTARTQGRAPWFDEAMRDGICAAMAIVQQHTDAKLRAYVVMSNHIHVLLQQGRRPLSDFMQPLLTRIALAVKRQHEPDGHVFGRTYWDCPCTDDAYLHALIDYIHANPVRASLTAHAVGWRWSSVHSYTTSADCGQPFVEPFWGGNRISSDVVWTIPGAPETRLDLRDLLMITLRELVGNDLTLSDVRTMRQSREITRLREQLIRKAAEAGYRGSVIARALCISETTVSRITRAARIGRPRLNV